VLRAAVVKSQIQVKSVSAAFLFPYFIYCTCTLNLVSLELKYFDMFMLLSLMFH